MVQRWSAAASDALAWMRGATRRTDEANVRLYAAAIAYRSIFSFLAFMTTVAVLGLMLFGVAPGELRGSLGVTGDIPGIPKDIEQVAIERAARTVELGASSAWVAGILGFGAGLYTLAGGFAALCEVLDRIHGTHSYRKLTRRYLRGTGIAVVFLALTFVALVTLFVSTEVGQQVFGLLGFERLSDAWTFLLRFVVPVAALLVAFAFVLRYGCHARPPWAEVLPGASVITIAWLGLLSAFLAYISLVGGFEFYGALGSVVAVLLFGYAQAWIVILAVLFRRDIAYVIALAPGIRRAKDGASIELDLPGGREA
jgi:membrane protein